MDVNLPDGIAAFLTAAGWPNAEVEPLAGDASFRRYFRVAMAEKSAMLMHAPPPEEDPAPFLRAARWLDENGMRAPLVLHALPEKGWVLLEDFGNVRMREYVDEWPADEHEVYASAIKALQQLHNPPPGPFNDYVLTEYQREARLFVDWYVPARGLYVDGRTWSAAWDEALAPMIPRQRPGVTVLRDYHAENIMLLGNLHKQGLLDFQDALIGHPAYDLVSLLQDARRDVSPELEAEMIDLYWGNQPGKKDFLADYARLGAKRNAKIVGIFVRLSKRDGKDRYLSMIPRVWAAMERDLAHPALAPVARWFDANIPAELRSTNGGNWPQ